MAKRKSQNPPVRPKKRSRKKLDNLPFVCGIAGGAAMLAGIAAMVIILLFSDGRKKPEIAIEDYFHALGDGDAIRLEALTPPAVQTALVNLTGLGESDTRLAAFLRSGQAEDGRLFGSGALCVDVSEVTTLEKDSIPEEVTALLRAFSLDADEVISARTVLTCGKKKSERIVHAFRIGKKWYCLNGSRMVQQMLDQDGSVKQLM